MTDGARALIFFDGRGDAGLTAAVWVLVAYLLGAIAAGAATAFAVDRIIARRSSGPLTQLQQASEGSS
jgi:hypothetical protein